MPENKFPIPDDALDDRLAFVGIAGSGKTYNAGTAIERILKMKRRVVIVDPLDVWWGLRLSAKGDSPAFDLPIFGGAHGDLPLNEHAGKIIGETVATMSQSCIVSLGSLTTKSAERRFMLAFLEAIYRNANGEPFHLVFDEADLWAPQKSSEPMLQSKMEEIVRRGRVKGFIPWLITQRPAVLSKDVLSQADGLVAFKLTSSHDRNAIGAWVEGQADKDQWGRIWSNMATLARGTGMVWIPARGILTTSVFPQKSTFDSSRTPKRGEKKSTAIPKPLDLGKLRERLAKVEETAKANDPATLRAEIERLRKANANPKQQGPVTFDPVQVEGVRDAARKRGYEEGFDYGYETAHRAFSIVIAKILEKTKTIPNLMNDAVRELMNEIAPPSVKPKPTPAPKPGIAPAVVKPSRVVERVPQTGGDIPGPEQKIVDAIRWWNALGVPSPSQAQVAFVAGYSHKSGTWSTYLGRLRSSGIIEGRGELLLTITGAAIAREPPVTPTAKDVQNAVLGKIDGPLRKILAPLLCVYPNGMSQSDLANEAGYSPSSGTWSTYLGRLRKLDLIEGRGRLAAQGWLFP